MKKIKCPMCGGEISGNRCMYCKNVIDDEKINQYKSSFDAYNLSIRQKIQKGEKLSLDEEKVFSFLLKNNLIDDNELDDAIILYFILTNNKLISCDLFEQVMKLSAEKTMKELNNGMIENYNPKVEILLLDKSNGCTFMHNVVFLDKNRIDKLYDGDISALGTYYHEIQHVFQSILFEKGYVSTELMIMLKDEIITESEFNYNNSNNYYWNNYQKISYEIDAIQKGFEYTKNLLDQMGLKISETNQLDFQSIIENKDRIVEIDGIKQIKSVDEIFDDVIKQHPHYLKKYPQLGIEYIKENGNVVRRSKESLNEMLENLNNEFLISYVQGLLDNYNEEIYK